MLSLENSQNIVFLLLCAVIIFILFLFNLKNWKRNFWNYQSIIYLMAMIGCFLEAGAFALKGNINLIWLQYVTNILYFASISTIAIYTLLYCAHRLYDKLFKTKISKFLVSIPYYINLIALCFAPKFHIVFCINAKGEYHRTFTYFFQMIPLGYLVFTLIYTLYCYYKAETLMAKKNALSFSVLSIAPIIIAVLQIAMPISDLI